MNIPRPLSPSIGIAASIALLAVSSTAQVTDPAIVETYGSNCGVTIAVNDAVQPSGDHLLNFAIGGDPFQVAVLVLGFQSVNVALPSGCQVLAEPLTLLAGLTDVSGNLAISVTLPSWATGHMYGQAAALDAAVNIETSRGLDMLFPGQSPTVDPTTDSSYSCYYISNYNWNYPGDGVATVTGRVRWPSATCNPTLGPPANRPIVIFMHGNNMDHQDHDYLMAHLARNGFVTCSIANGSHLGGSNIGRAEQAISYLNAMQAYWQWSGRLSNDVIFMGHSRGGEAAITAARLLKENPSMAHIPYDVRAVVSIAPTDGGPSGTSHPKENIDGLTTTSFLGLYGSRDPDVRGIRLEDPLNGPESTVFAIYDRAGSEASSEGLLFPVANLTKSLVFVEGATHRGFMDGCNFLDGGTIGCESHRNIANGYINAFLQWRIFNQPDYQGYFDGSAQPTAVRVEDIELWTQLDEPLKRVVDNFEQGGLATNTRGGSVLAYGNVGQIAENELWQLNPSAPHETRGLRIKWADNTARVRWGIPDTTVPFAGDSRNVTGFNYISLRVAQDYLDAWNTPGVDQNFSLRMYTAGGFSINVPISDYGRVPYPNYFFTNPIPYPAGDYTKSAMTTIRVPLSAFTGADLTHIVSLYLYFDDPSHPIGSVFIDSLQFVN